jgi:hypothetical protein
MCESFYFSRKPYRDLGYKPPEAGLSCLPREPCATADVGHPIEGDPDLFVIDCEGMNSFGKTTATLKQATFALSQMSSMTLLVAKSQVNLENIDSIRSLFVLSHAFSRDIPGFTIGTAIMMREVGVRLPRGTELTLQEQNQIRQAADEAQRDIILQVLNDAQIKFCTDDFLVLAQPFFDQEELYWNSMNDFLLFAAQIASQRATITGKTLIQMFHEAKSSIMKISDFENPRIPFAEIIDNIVLSDLKAASDAAMANLEYQLQPYFQSLSSSRLREGLDVHFVGQQSVTVLKRFEQNASKLFPHLLDYSKKKTTDTRHQIEFEVQSKCNELFVRQCIDVLLPDLQQEVFRSITTKIQSEMQGLEVKDVKNFNFAHLADQYDSLAKTTFEYSVKMAHEGLFETPACGQSMLALRLLVSIHVENLESARKVEYIDFVEREREREAEESNARLREDIKKAIQKEETERARLGKETAETEQEFKRIAAEHIALLETTMTALERRIQAEREFQEQLNAITEKHDQEQEALKQRLLAEHQESDKRREREREAERKAAEARYAALQAQIAQLRNNPAVVYKRRPRRVCSVY